MTTLAEPTVSPAAPVDLVNAALLGTDRRPLPDAPGPDAAGWLLDEAGRARATRLVTGASTTVVLDLPAPAADHPSPPAAARGVLDEVLLQGSDALVDLWLRESLDAGFGLAPEHWVPLLDRSRRSTGLDRRRLATVLGARGLWFARQDPAWSSVVRAAATPAATARSRSVAELVAVPSTTPVAAARALGVEVGAGLPLAAYAEVPAAAVRTTEPTVRAALAVAEEVLWLRWGMAVAFDPARTPPDRAPIDKEHA